MRKLHLGHHLAIQIRKQSAHLQMSYFMKKLFCLPWTFSGDLFNEYQKRHIQFSFFIKLCLGSIDT